MQIKPKKVAARHLVLGVPLCDRLPNPPSGMHKWHAFGLKSKTPAGWRALCVVGMNKNSAIGVFPGNALNIATR
jgi:hypothetical protein